MIYFPHIPKAGGTSLKSYFLHAYSASSCIKVWDTKFGADFLPDEFCNLKADELKGIPAVIGHLPVKDFLSNSAANRMMSHGEVQVITSVRDPIDRLLSLYNYVLVNEHHPNHNAHQSFDPKEFVFSQQENFQFKFLELRRGMTVDDLFACISIFPMEKSLTLFHSFFKNVLSQDVKLQEIQNDTASINLKGKDIIKRDFFTSSELKFLYSKHELDYEIHQKSLALFNSKSREIKR
ncbi:sulfotransferase family 2 domain-containing protein [Aestuariirhabdus sp. LZHN29]|uniref:sulfotransferase family 2 domain-containing protein n=1 Tax=Aestuariirhabdus sp. LZHN29 TaxID=3417462 RepID=UPI003CF26EA1